MIHRGESPIRAADFESALAESRKGLGRGHFVDQVQVNVKNRGSAFLFGDYVRVPDFLKESFRLICHIRYLIKFLFHNDLTADRRQLTAVNGLSSAVEAYPNITPKSFGTFPLPSV
jgi:hypothetical protein